MRTKVVVEDRCHTKGEQMMSSAGKKEKRKLPSIQVLRKGNGMQNKNTCIRKNHHSLSACVVQLGRLSPVVLVDWSRGVSRPRIL